MNRITGKTRAIKRNLKLDPDMVDALKDFICRVWLMRKAQKEFKQSNSVADAVIKTKYEMQIDRQLAILVPKGKEAADA